MLKAYLFNPKKCNFVFKFKIMKIFTYIIFALAVVFIGFNATMLDFDNLFEGKSLIAIIGILATMCAVVLILIFNLSKAIDEKLKKHS